MALLSIRMEDTDLEKLKVKVADLGITFTIYARSLIVQALEDEEEKQ